MKDRERADHGTLVPRCRSTLDVDSGHMLLMLCCTCCCVYCNHFKVHFFNLVFDFMFGKGVIIEN